jgi:hypothetical protein
MRTIRGFSLFVLSTCLVLANGTRGFAGEGETATAKAKKEAHRTPAPGSMGAPREADLPDASHRGPDSATVTEYQNELGQTVYSAAASHFDISPPLLEMAAAAGSHQAVTEVEQKPIKPSESPASGNAPLAAPTLGFNFAGVPITSVQASDCNGSVGNNQFVETVNARYQVWSLNRSTLVATSILGPTSLATLWTGFGGECEAVSTWPYADPIVLYDKIANRWLISEFSIPGHFLCVALSTSANATGTYARYAFPMPNGVVVDYPKVGVWTDAYYMFSMTGNHPFAFAAMDRTKMLAGNPAATWQVIQDELAQRAMPADIDGFALPPSKAPGIFVWAEFTGNNLQIVRMKVNFTTPSLTTKTTQAIVPVAPIVDACPGFVPCIPQPGTTNVLNSMSGFVMFRAAYRNYMTTNRSSSAAPSIPVSGLVAECAGTTFAYRESPQRDVRPPCVYQKGRSRTCPTASRWLPATPWTVRKISS